MNINLADYLTIQQAAEAMGTNRRAVHRAIARAREAGHEVVESVLGRSLIHKANLATLKGFYFPIYGENHQAMVREWGRRGGATKAANRAKSGVATKPPEAEAPKRPRGRPRKNPLPAAATSTHAENGTAGKAT